MYLFIVPVCYSSTVCSKNETQPSIVSIALSGTIYNEIFDVEKYRNLEILVRIQSSCKVMLDLYLTEIYGPRLSFCR